MLGTIFNRIAASAFGRWGPRRVQQKARRARLDKDLAAALQLLLQGVERYPEDAVLWNELAVLQIERRDLQAAAVAVGRALDHSPDLPQGHCNMGIILAEKGEEEAALRSFRRAFELEPGMLSARENYAFLASKTQRADAALAAWDEVLRLDPRHARAHVVKGGVLMSAGRFAEATESLDRAEALIGTTPDIALYRAVIDADTGEAGRGTRAIEALRGRIGDAAIDWHLAMVYLSEGDFARGWPLYEARPSRTDPRKRRPYDLPEWQGESVAEGALLVAAEQGLGDEIMFASCFPDVIERAPRCVIECDPRLTRLFERSFPDARIVGAARDNDGSWTRDLPGLSRQVLAGSLPRLFRREKESFPRSAGYLRPDSRLVDAWRDRLGALPGDLKVGIAWNGGLDHTRRALRCLPLPDLAGLLQGSQHVFVSLQHDDKGDEAPQLTRLSGTPVHRFPRALADLDEQAALIAALDVVITVCSSVVHLSGALGARTWVFTPQVPEWRYLRAGETLPWYPAVKLFRQGREGGWGGVVSRVSQALAELRSETLRRGQA